ncbi:iron-sulfur cluster assembly scaffold protein [Bacillus paralicheniformis]|nr:iron-sulfur cluster assembly scaffold protein [Bacillus paralicheniformis]UWS62910.1 iron-sulfur cluster assembly scaffold protein [Bacillus paralicheniformis]
MQLDDLYRRVIMDHYKKPRNRGTFDSDAVTSTSSRSIRAAWVA